MRVFLSKDEGAAKRQVLIPLCTVLGFCLAIAEQAKADFVGYYDLTNFTLTNTNNGGFPSFTNGTAKTSDGGQSVVVTGGNSGSGLAGTTDLVISAATSGMVQFDWSYSSSDISSRGQFPFGCGAGFAQACDDAGYLLAGNFVQLASDTAPGSGLVTFAVTAGETFGFRVETADNLGGAGLLTVSAFSAPAAVPEPNTAGVLFCLAAILVAAHRKVTRNSRKPESAA